MTTGWGAFVLGCMLLWAPPSFAEGFSDPNRLWEELWADHLPDYCLYLQQLPDRETPGKYNSIKGAEYKQAFGPESFHHLHHYCFGLDILYQVATAEDDMIRRSMYYEAIKEFNYILSRSPNSFVLKPEIFVNKGATWELLGNYTNAVESYLQAVTLKPDYDAAYLGLSNCFEVLGDRRQALTIVERGLEKAPNSAALSERRAELMTRAADGSR